jgi:DNA polymerase-3 subunit gamma/tau
MVLIRLCYASELPDPATVLKQLKDGTIVASGGGARVSSAPTGGNVASFSGGNINTVARPAHSVPQSQPVANANLTTLSEIVGLLEQHGAMNLASQVINFVELVKLEPQRLEFHPAEGADSKLAFELGKKLSELTGARWIVTVSMKQGQKTIATERRLAIESERAAVIADPVVAKILNAFPNTEIISITNKE